MMYLLLIFIGSCFGSLASCIAYRLPRDINYTTKRSECTSCGHKLGILDLIPIFSCLFFKAKCRYCGTKFGYSYLWLEIFTAILFCINYFIFGLSPQVFIMCFLGFTSVLLTKIDLDFYIIPNGLNLIIFFLALSFKLSLPIVNIWLIILPILGISFGYLLRYIGYFLKKTEALGLGDVKLLAGCFLFLELEVLNLFFLISGLFGVIFGILWKRFTGSNAFPFGPSLICSLNIVIWYSYISGIYT